VSGDGKGLQLARKTRTRSATATEARVYLRKAEQFCRTMREASEKKDWDAVALNAIHCAISANDALLGFRHGIRSAGGSHDDAALLLDQLEEGEDSRQNSVRLRRIIRKKNLVEYEGRSLTGPEAAKIAADAERFLQWAKSKME